MLKLIFRHRLCCSILSLKVGCKIIGVLSTFFCVLKTAFACRILIKLLYELDKLKLSSMEHEAPVWRIFGTNTCPFSNFEMFALTIVDILTVVYGLIGSILLLHGIKTKRPKLFIPYLYFCGLIICSKMSVTLGCLKDVIPNIFNILMWCYIFLVVVNYRWQLLEELSFPNDEIPPEIAVTLPQESHVQVSVPAQESESSTDYIKDDPPPPYPGLPNVLSTQNIESQPPPYAVAISSNSESRDQIEDSCSSLCQRAASNSQMRNVS